MQKVVVFGPGPQFKGGISNFTVSLCKALEKQGNEVHLVSWTQQYPAIIPRDFIDRNSRTNLLEGSKIKVHYITNYNNPITWYKTANLIASIAPQKVIFQWAIAIQGLPMGVIAQRVKKKLPACEIIFDVHNVVQKETGELDKILTRFALKKADTLIMHGQITIDEFSAFMPEVKFMVSTDGSRSKEMKTILKLFHPIYDIFVPDAHFDVEQERKKEKLGTTVFLFFGFIRKYKGLHYTIEAFSRIAQKYPDTSLIIAGESFWDTVDKKKWHVKLKSVIFKMLKSIFIKSNDQEKDYRPLDLIEKFGIKDRVLIANRFIANEEVHRFFQLSDVVVNYYEYATPSGVESIAYNFNKPILATRVGHFAHAILDGKNGYLAEPADISSMEKTMEKFINHPISEEIVEGFKKSLSWEKYVESIRGND